jgi:hypothetical protein
MWKALTLTQPWCGLVAAGLKPIENRQRPMIRREDFNRPFALHASRAIDEAQMRRIIEIAPELCTDMAAPWIKLASITSAIIGVATIERAIVMFTRADGSAYAVDMATREVVDLGEDARWFFGPIGYVLRDIRPLAEPIPCRGWQSFWTVPVEHVKLIEDQLARVA